MGLYLRQDEQRTELQTRVATEMQERLRKKPAMQVDDTSPSMLRDMDFAKNISLTVTMLIAGLFVIAMIILFQLT